MWASTCGGRRFFQRTCETADEAFITSTTREISPVVRIDDRVIGNGKPGPVTLMLLEGYRKRARSMAMMQ